MLNLMYFKEQSDRPSSSHEGDDDDDDASVQVDEQQPSTTCTGDTSEIDDVSASFEPTTTPDDSIEAETSDRRRISHRRNLKSAIDPNFVYY